MPFQALVALQAWLGSSLYRTLNVLVSFCTKALVPCKGGDIGAAFASKYAVRAPLAFLDLYICWTTARSRYLLEEVRSAAILAEASGIDDLVA